MYRTTDPFTVPCESLGNFELYEKNSPQIKN